MSSKLKSCPFCGCEARIETVENYFRVGCEALEKCSVLPATFNTSRDKAIEAWNYRPNPWHTETPTVIEASTGRESENNPKERTWFGNEVAYDFPNCENYKDGRCEVFNCACKDEIACNTKFKKRWEKK